MRLQQLGAKLFSLTAAASTPFLLAACASHKSSAAGPVAENAERISGGLQRLGASEKRGECFGRRVIARLNDDDADEAARVVEKAASKSDMRERVLGASKPVRRAFIGANMRCSLS